MAKPKDTNSTDALRLDDFGQWLCHELASPLGAALQGLDLVETGDAESLAHTREALDAARARLEAFRVMLAPGADDAAREIMMRLARTQDIRLSWDAEHKAHTDFVPLLCAMIYAALSLSRRQSVLRAGFAHEGAYVDFTAQGSADNTQNNTALRFAKTLAAQHKTRIVLILSRTRARIEARRASSDSGGANG